MEDEHQRKVTIVTRVLVAVGVTVAVVATNPPVGAATEPTSYQLGFFEQRKVKAAVADMMRDPDSARFSGIYAMRLPDGSIDVCGWVSGRNGFGGMGQEIPFKASIFASGRAYATSIANPAVTAVMCNDAGLFSQDMVKAIRAAYCPPIPGPARADAGADRSS